VRINQGKRCIKEVSSLLDLEKERSDRRRHHVAAHASFNRSPRGWPDYFSNRMTARIVGWMMDCQVKAAIQAFAFSPESR
jgi:hypothetical protein